MLWACFSYSETVYTYDYTKNAADNALSWSMDSLFPEGIVDINGVVYRYTTVKNTSDDMKVHVQNKDARGSGYIFRETDDWSGLPSGTISKVVSLGNIPLEYFGEGSIDVEGTGSVIDSFVQYSYRIQPLEVVPEDVVYIPEDQPIEIYNVLDEEVLDDGVYENRYESEDEEQEERKEKAKKVAGKAIGIGNTAAQQAMMLALSNATNMNSYYAKAIDGGTYKENVNLVDTKLPENKRGLRNGLAQQIMHDRMVMEQYK